MKKTRMVGAAACMAVVIGFGGPASAGEWSPGNDELTPVKADSVASSECAFSGRNRPNIPNGGGEPAGPNGFDDGLWSSTPAKGNVQSPGQLVAAGIVPPGTPGEACRGGGPAGR